MMHMHAHDAHDAYDAVTVTVTVTVNNTLYIGDFESVMWKVWIT